MVRDARRCVFATLATRLVLDLSATHFFLIGFAFCNERNRLRALLVELLWMRKMRRASTIIFSLLATVALAPAARAADLISYPTSTAEQVPVAPADSTFNWSGFYAGVYGAYRKSSVAGDQFGAGIDAGVNVTFNYVLAGAEVSVEGLGGNNATSYVSGVGRAGLLVTDNALLYGAAGYGIDTGAPDESDALVGGGLEYAITNNLSVRGQYLHGVPVTGANPKDEVSLGAQFHF